MRMYKILAASSILINIILFFLLFRNHSGNNDKSGDNMPIIFSKEKDLSNRYNFEKIFLEKNDSVYKNVYNKSFEDLPVQAYLLACTYYLIKKDSSSKRDIEMISSEIKAIYGKSPDIFFLK